MELLQEIVERDKRYKLEAYLLVNDGLQHSLRQLAVRRHISGSELLEGIRLLALERYGRMAKAVLNSWGLFTTDDIGNVVFNLVNAGLMSKTETDTIEEFHAVYDFEDVFVRNYHIPARPRQDSDRDEKEN
ncbi:MAG: Minf_1886 family protein [candidate division WOR-3 bacterium]